MRICIDARVADGPYEGVGAVIRSLIAALTALEDGSEEYYFLAYRHSHEWLRPFIKHPRQLLFGPSQSGRSPWRAISYRVPALRTALARVVPPSRRLPTSDGTIEAAGIDVMHFTMQGAFLTSVPSIYSPHDLQHIHLPHFFTRRTCARRELLYRAFCHQAQLVAIMSTAGKVDLVENYGLPEEKVVIVPWAAAIENSHTPSLCDISEVKKKFALPEAFAFYPAHTWPHKNHLGLLDALVVLRENYGLEIPLICSGHCDHFFRQIASRISRLGLERQVRFLGFLTRDELSCVYAASRFMVFPSKFEGWGLPICEAFSVGTPVACSDISPLREQVLDAALLFDPNSPAEIAAAIHRMWIDDVFRTDIARRGRLRSALFSWDRTARAFRALYRKLANRPLTEQDRGLLSAAPIV